MPTNVFSLVFSLVVLLAPLRMFVVGNQSSNNVATICSYSFVTKFGYYNEHHDVEIWLLYFPFSPLSRITLKFWLAIWVHDASK